MKRELEKNKSLRFAIEIYQQKQTKQKLRERGRKRRTEREKKHE